MNKEKENNKDLLNKMIDGLSSFSILLFRGVVALSIMMINFSVKVSEFILKPKVKVKINKKNGK